MGTADGWAGHSLLGLSGQWLCMCMTLCTCYPMHLLPQKGDSLTITHD